MQKDSTDGGTVPLDNDRIVNDEDRQKAIAEIVERAGEVDGVRDLYWFLAAVSDSWLRGVFDKKRLYGRIDGDHVEDFLIKVVAALDKGLPQDTLEMKDGVLQPTWQTYADIILSGFELRRDTTVSQ